MRELAERTSVAARLGAAVGAAFGLAAAAAQPMGWAHALERQIPLHVGAGVGSGLALAFALGWPAGAPAGGSPTRLAASLVAAWTWVVGVRVLAPRNPLTRIVGEEAVWLATSLGLAAAVVLGWRLFVRVLEAQGERVPTADAFFAGLLGASLTRGVAALGDDSAVVIAFAAGPLAGLAVSLRLPGRVGAALGPPGRGRRMAHATAWVCAAAALAGASWRGMGPIREAGGFLRSPALGDGALVTVGREVRAVLPAGPARSYLVGSARRVELGWGVATIERAATFRFTATLTAADGTAARLLDEAVEVPARAPVRWFSRTVELPSGAEPRRLTLAYEGASEGGFWAPPGFARRGAAPSVVLVSLDTVRADHLNAYGYSRRATSPELDAWAQEGALFENAVACAPATLSSQMSILTGLYPSAHGVTYESWRSSGLIPVLGAEVETLAGTLAARGMLTAAFTGAGYFSMPIGYSRGFATFVSSSDETLGGATTVFEKAFAWMAAHADVPFFLFLHTYEAHEPYLDQRFAFAEGLGPQDHAARQEALYDGDLRRVDDYLGRLRRRIAELGLAERTLVVIVSDHGEEFGDHFQVWADGHGHALYDEQVRVPFVAIGPGVARGRRVRPAVDLTAVAPTILEYVGAAVPAAMRGRRLLDLLRGGPEPVDDGWAAFSDDVWIGAARRAVRTAEWKLIARDGELPERFLANEPRRRLRRELDRLPPLMLFNVAKDPRERADRAGAQPAVAARLRRLLHDHRAGLGRAPRREHIRLDGDVRDRLRALGYVD